MLEIGIASATYKLGLFAIKDYDLVGPTWAWLDWSQGGDADSMARFFGVCLGLLNCGEEDGDREESVWRVFVVGTMGELESSGNGSGTAFSHNGSDIWELVESEK